MTAKQRLKQIQTLVGASPDGIIGNETLTKFQCRFQVPSKAMVAHFFGNLHHESGGFTIVEENMNYTSASRIRAVWPSRFKLIPIRDKDGKIIGHNDEALPYVRKPIELANSVYGGRMGNNMPNDGWKFRGRGYMQTTGKYSYDRLGKFLGVDLIANPDLVATLYPLESAIFYFNDNRIWNLVSDISEESIRKVRYRINGGYNGIQDVINKVKYYYNLMR